MVCFPLRRKSRFQLFSRNGLNAQRVRATNKRRACATRETRTQTAQGIHNSMYYTLDLLRVRFHVQVSGHVWDDRRLYSATRLFGRHPSRCSAPLVFALRVTCVCACVLVRLSHPRPPDRSQHGCTVGVLPGPTRVLPMPRQCGIGRRAPTRAVLSCAASWCVVVRRIHGLWNMPPVRFVLCPLA